MFIFGDLNYRLGIKKEQAASLNPRQKFLTMIRHDSLRQQDPLKQFLTEFTEGTLNFAPTYKLLPFENEFDHSRIPGWTDRIFFRSENQEM